MEKATLEEIKERFDIDVEEFSDLDTGQVSIIDSKIYLELVTEVSKRIKPNSFNLLDVGCGAGNYTIMMLSKIKNLNCTLVDLSKAMLDKAFERISKHTNGKIRVIQGDIKSVELKENEFDIILSGAVLHHLRSDKDWEDVFNKLYIILKPGGCLLISDLVTQDNSILTEYVMEMYLGYLEKIRGKEYSKKILEYIVKEDTPRSINYQLNLMKKVGFKSVEILHKNMCFGSFGAIK
jgi:tRNA (cmo5U34)-methyltransferase